MIILLFQFLEISKQDSEELGVKCLMFSHCFQYFFKVVYLSVYASVGQIILRGPEKFHVLFEPRKQNIFHMSRKTNILGVTNLKMLPDTGLCVNESL